MTRTALAILAATMLAGAAHAGSIKGHASTSAHNANAVFAKARIDAIRRCNDISGIDDAAHYGFQAYTWASRVYLACRSASGL